MASVTFKRGTRAEIEATAKQDGQILMETDQNKKNKMYIDLPDGSRVLIGNSGEAIDTSYDNTTSGLDATNVQSAIDEVSAKIGQENISQVGNSVTGAINNLNSNLSSKVNSDHFIIAGGLTLPSSSEGLIYKKDYLVGYLPIASITKVYSQYRTNVFDVALANDGSVYGINIPSNAYKAECIILFVKNKSF